MDRRRRTAGRDGRGTGSERDDEERAAGLAMDERAAEMHVVRAQLALDEGTRAVRPDVVETEELRRLLNQHRSHVHRSRARLRIHAAHMRNADREVQIAHDLTEDPTRSAARPTRRRSEAYSRRR